MHAWWILVSSRDVASFETLDHVHLPERPGAVEVASGDSHRQLGQLALVARGRHRDMAEMEVEIEVRIFDPIGVVQTEGHLDEPTTKRRHQVESRLDELANLLISDRVRCRVRVEHRQGRHVPVGGRRLQSEERAVEA